MPAVADQPRGAYVEQDAPQLRQEDERISVTGSHRAQVGLIVDVSDEEDDDWFVILEPDTDGGYYTAPLG